MPCFRRCPSRRSRSGRAICGTRHSALCAGADPAEVAQWAGNSVEVPLSRYAKWLDYRQAINNQCIEGLLGEYDQPREPREPGEPGEQDED